MATPSISGVGEKQSQRIAAPTCGTRTSSDVVPRPCQVNRSPLSRRRGRHVSKPSLLAFSSCAASAFLCLLLHAVADVASWMSLAIIAQRAPQECWGGVGFHWSQQEGCVFVRELNLHPGQNRLDTSGRFGALRRGPTGSRHHFGLDNQTDRLSQGSGEKPS